MTHRQRETSSTGPVFQIQTQLFTTSLLPPESYVHSCKTPCRNTRPEALAVAFKNSFVEGEYLRQFPQLAQTNDVATIETALTTMYGVGLANY